MGGAYVAIYLWPSPLFREGIALWRTRRNLPEAEITEKADDLKSK